MIKIRKSNKFIIIILTIVCFIFILNPSFYGKSCLNAVSVWAFKVFPLMFPFFILTRLISNLSEIKSNPMDKFFNKIYHTPKGSFMIFFLSVLSGYPMGAKLISSLYENNRINSNQAKKLFSICSVSGPMFMVGTVGVAMLSSYKAGIVILLSNIVASLINGLIYRGKVDKENNAHYISKKEDILTNSVYDSLISILMVGSYIVLSFLLIDLLTETKILFAFINAICCVFNLSNYQSVVQSVVVGIIEITRGILDLSTTNISLKIKTIIASSLIGFGGISVMLQSVSFLSKVKLNVKTMIKQKFTQCIICLVVTIILSLIFFR